ncbi:MAG: DUF928 domain-containing protein [Cyanobacteria bacterium P01_H01_bin.105]
MARLLYITRLLSMFAVPIAALSLFTPAMGQSALQPELAAVQYNPPNRGAPSETRNALSRAGLCGNLTAIQPSQTNWGETIRERPTFAIYVDESAKNLTFELEDKMTGETLHNVIFDQVTGPGISLYTLPDTAPALEIDHQYRWQVSLECEQFSTPQTPQRGTKASDGTIVRRTLSNELQTALATTADNEKPALLAANGLWYDTVQTLLAWQLTYPDTETWVEQWQGLLKHPMVQLHDLLESAPVDCCLAANCPTASADMPDTERLVAH